MITLTELAPGPTGGDLLLVGPSLGTAVETLWGEAAVLLGESYRVVGWDLPGHGHSPVATGPFSLADLADAVLDAVGSPFHHAGVSVAGAVGLHLGLTGSELVRSSAVVCSGAKLGTREAWQERAALVRSEGVGALVDGSRARWFSDRTRAERGEIVEALLAELPGMDAASYAWLCEALGKHDVRAQLGQITVPTLALCGGDDVVCPPELMAEVADGVQKGRLTVLPEVGHLAPAEDPAGTAAALGGTGAAAPGRPTWRAPTRR